MKNRAQFCLVGKQVSFAEQCAGEVRHAVVKHSSPSSAQAKYDTLCRTSLEISFSADELLDAG